MRTSQPNLPFYGLDIVAKFPILTVAAFTPIYGGAPRAFDYFKPIKLWRDNEANPAKPNRREFFVYKVATGPNGEFQADKDGFVEPTETGMSADEAWAVNIPPDIGLGTVPGSTPLSEVRMPIELMSNERLQQGPFGGNLRVRRVDIPEGLPVTPAAGGFTEGDRQMLIEIYRRGK